MTASRRINVCIFLVIILTVALNGCALRFRNDKIEERPLSASGFHLDTLVTVSLYDGGDESVLTEAFEEIERLEKILSAETPESDLGILSQNAGKMFSDVSPETVFLLKESGKFSEMSGGAFDCTIGPLVSLWDIKKRIEGIPSDGEISGALALVGYEKVLFEGEKGVMLKEAGMEVTFGAIAKGYIGDRVKSLLIERGVKSAVINLGGNVVLLGEKAPGTPFQIGVQNPGEETGGYMGVIASTDKCLVSSGPYQRYFNYNGKAYHHILDPATGFPAENELSGVTVICGGSTEADALSTTAFLLGLENGLALLNGIEGADGIFLTKDKKVYLTDGIGDEFKITSTEYKLAQ